jgi:hypothetical protein
MFLTFDTIAFCDHCKIVVPTQERLNDAGKWLQPECATCGNAVGVSVELANG